MLVGRISGHMSPVRNLIKLLDLVYRYFMKYSKYLLLRLERKLESRGRSSSWRRAERPGAANIPERNI